MSIFYAYSRLNKGNVCSTYLKIYDKFKDELVNDEKSAQLFICDITPDYCDNNMAFVDSDLMIHLGLALQNFKNNNILLLLDESITKNVPLLLKNYNIHYYNSTLNDYHLEIINKIKINSRNYNLSSNDKYFDVEF
jgi:hypothetical protein